MPRRRAAEGHEGAAAVIVRPRSLLLLILLGPLVVLVVGTLIAIVAKWR
jgi:hypothetical protein